jgi:DNA-binding NarL/FixJ family response regulator
MPRRVLAPPPGLEAYELDLGDRRVVLFEWDSGSTSRQAPPADFSVAERSLLGPLLAGISTREIATARGRSERTIANQISKIFRKCGVSSRSELAALFAEGFGVTAPN